MTRKSIDAGMILVSTALLLLFGAVELRAEAGTQAPPFDHSVRADRASGGFRAFPLAHRTVATDDRGHFVVAGLETGVYALMGRKEGFASQPIEIRIDESGQSIALAETLALIAQSQLTLTLDPPLDPWNQPWQVLVTREIEESKVYESVTKGAAADQGTWISPRIDPGNYLVTIVDSQGGMWRSESVELLGGPESLFWNIEVVPVRGQTTLGGDPLVAELLFGSGTNAITFKTDAIGAFEGSLPKEGSWPVRLKAETMRLALDPVEVRRRFCPDAEPESCQDVQVLQGSSYLLD